MHSQLFVIVVVVALYGSLFDGSVHALYLPVCPWMVGFGETTVDAVAMADAIERVAAQQGCWTFAILGQVGELDAVVSKHGVDAIRNRCNQCFQESCRRAHIGLLDQFNKGEFRCAVDSYEEMEFSLCGSHFGQVDVKVSNRIAFKLLPLGLVALHFWQTADAMSPQTAMKRGTGKRWESLPGVHTDNHRAIITCACGRPR